MTKVVDLTVDGASHVTAEKVADLGRKVLAYQRLLLVNAGLPIGWDDSIDMPPRLRETPTLCAFSGLRLLALIVDYWSGSESIRKRLSAWLKLLGFEVKMSSCETKMSSVLQLHLSRTYHT